MPAIAKAIIGFESIERALKAPIDLAGKPKEF